jgi:hypothetical protein
MGLLTFAYCTPHRFGIEDSGVSQYRYNSTLRPASLKEISGPMGMYEGRETHTLGCPECEWTTLDRRTVRLRAVTLRL